MSQFQDGKDVHVPRLDHGQAVLDDFARVQEKLAPQVVQERLFKDGYVVIDDFWGAERAAIYRSEIHHLLEHGGMLPNRTQFASASGGVMQATKPHIYELDLHHDHVRASLPALAALFQSTAVPDAIRAAAPGQVLSGPRHVTLKLQVNEGNGGCFPAHYDNPGAPNKRRVTMLTYLNPEWKDGDGGELQLLPFLSEPVLVQPVMDRAVFFLSDVMLHRVLPATVRRYCFTVWIDGAHTNAPADNAINPAAFPDLAGLVAHLRASPSQRLLARVVYQELFAHSLRQCMAGAHGETEMLAAHDLHLERAAANRALMALVAKLREYHGMLAALHGWDLRV